MYGVALFRPPPPRDNATVAGAQWLDTGSAPGGAEACVQTRTVLCSCTAFYPPYVTRDMVTWVSSVGSVHH